MGVTQRFAWALLACLAQGHPGSVDAGPAVSVQPNDVALAPASAQAPPKRGPPTRSRRGHVDWQARQFVAEAEVLPYGNARLWQDVSRLGEALAEDELRHAFAEQVANLPLGCGAETPAAFLRQDPRWAVHVAGAVRHFVTTSTVYGADGRVSLVATLPFDGGKARLGAFWAALWQAHGAGAPRLPGTAAKRPSAAGAGHTTATGVVIQAMGLKVTRVLWPRVVDRAGREIYGPGVVRPDVFAARGVAPYHTSLEDALHDPRVSERPLVVRAAAVYGAGGGDVALAHEDVATLEDQLSLLQDGRVVFVTDGP